MGGRPLSAGVRAAIAADLPFIAALEAETFSDAAAADTLERMMADGRHVFFVCEGGYAWYEYVLDEGYIGNIAVAPSFRRRGLGRALTEAMMADAMARGLAFLTLEVRQSNAPARALYESCGFTVVGTRRGYYEKPREDAVLMTRFFP